MIDEYVVWFSYCQSWSAYSRKETTIPFKVDDKSSLYVFSAPMRPVSTRQPRSILFWSGDGWLEVNIKQTCVSGIRCCGPWFSSDHGWRDEFTSILYLTIQFTARSNSDWWSFTCIRPWNTSKSGDMRHKITAVFSGKTCSVATSISISAERLQPEVSRRFLGRNQSQLEHAKLLEFRSEFLFFLPIAQVSGRTLNFCLCKAKQWRNCWREWRISQP